MSEDVFSQRLRRKILGQLISELLVDSVGSDDQGVAVRERVDYGDQHAVVEGLDQEPVARFVLPGQGCLRGSPLQRWGLAPGLGRRRGSPLHGRSLQNLHFVTVTVVPSSRFDTIWKSSTIRRTPGSPSPRPPDVE